MKRPRIRQVLTAGVIAAGLGVTGAGAALATSGVAAAAVKPTVTQLHPAGWPFGDLDDLDDLDNVVRIPEHLAPGYIAMDNDWDDWDDDWDDWDDDWDDWGDD